MTHALREAPCRCPCHGEHEAAPEYADSYPALIPEAQLADDETTAAVRVCDATGNTVRGPLLPVELGGRRIWLCRVCFAAYRRSVAPPGRPATTLGRTGAVIEDHVFRPGQNTVRDYTGERGGSRIPPGTCVWLGTCARPPDDHITVPDFRARRGER